VFCVYLCYCSYVFAPVIFNMSLVAVTLLVREIIMRDDGVELHFRLDDNLFNMRSLQARTKVTSLQFFVLQYADHCALVTHTPEGMRHLLSVVASVYRSVGLQINVSKTQVLYSVLSGSS
jgi:hypothetical protein